MATRSLGTLTLDLIARIAGFEQPLSQAERQAKRTARELNAQAASIKREWAGLGKALAGAFAGLTAGSVLQSFIRNTIEAQDAQAQLAAVLKSTGSAAGFTQVELNRMSDAMSAASTFSRNEIANAQTTLLAFTQITGEQFKAAQQAAVDMAARTGMSVKQAAETVGRALDVPSAGMAALSKQGFRFSEAQKQIIKDLEGMGRVAEAQQIIIGELESSYGGAAEAARNTLGGALADLKNAVGDLLTGDDSSVSGLTKAINSLSDALRSDAARSTIETLGVVAQYTAAILASRYVVALVSATRNVKLLSGAVAILTRAVGGIPGLLVTAGAAFSLWAVKTMRAKDAAREAATEIETLNDAAAAVTDVVIQNSAAYDEMAAKIEERRALIGKETAAAQLAARIQLGLITGLNAGEGERLVALTATADAEEAAYKRRKQAQQDALRAAQAAASEQQRQRDAIQSQIAAMQEQVTVFAMSADAAELYRARIAGATDADLERMRVLQAARAAQQAGRDAAEAAAQKQEQINAEVLQLAEGLKSEEQLIRESYARRRDMILSATGEASRQQMELLAKNEAELQNALAGLQATYWDKWLEAAEAHLTSFDEIAGNTIENVSNRFGAAFESMIFDAQSLGDSVRNLAEGMARSIVNAIGQMIAQWTALKLVQMATGKSAQGAAVGALASNAQATSMQAGLAAYASTAAIPIVGPAAAPAAMAQALSVTGPMAAAVAGLASAGLVGMAHDGMQSIPKTGTWLLEKGERVTTEATSSKLDATLDAIRRDQRGEASAPAVNIKAINVLDPSVVGDYLATDAGERAIINVMRRNRRMVAAG